MSEDRGSKCAPRYYNIAVDPQNAADPWQFYGHMAKSGEQILDMACFALLSNWFLNLRSGFDDTSVDLQLTEMDS